MKQLSTMIFSIGEGIFHGGGKPDFFVLLKAIKD